MAWTVIDGRAERLEPCSLFASRGLTSWILNDSMEVGAQGSSRSITLDPVLNMAMVLDVAITFALHSERIEKSKACLQAPTFR